MYTCIYIGTLYAVLGLVQVSIFNESHILLYTECIYIYIYTKYTLYSQNSCSNKKYVQRGYKYIIHNTWKWNPVLTIKVSLYIFSSSLTIKIDFWNKRINYSLRFTEVIRCISACTNVSRLDSCITYIHPYNQVYSRKKG